MSKSKTAYGGISFINSQEQFMKRGMDLFKLSRELNNEAEEGSVDLRYSYKLLPPGSANFLRNIYLESENDYQLNQHSSSRLAKTHPTSIQNLSFDEPESGSLATRHPLRGLGSEGLLADEDEEDGVEDGVPNMKLADISVGKDLSISKDGDKAGEAEIAPESAKAEPGNDTVAGESPGISREGGGGGPRSNETMKSGKRIPTPKMDFSYSTPNTPSTSRSDLPPQIGTPKEIAKAYRLPVKAFSPILEKIIEGQRLNDDDRLKINNALPKFQRAVKDFINSRKAGAKK